MKNCSGKHAFAIGLDFGSLSVRALLVDVHNGDEIAASEFVYPHGIMTTKLPTGTELPKSYALHHPKDYIDGLYYCITEVLRTSKVNVEQVIGIGVDATASTILPVDADDFPLCFQQKYQDNPHAYIKLWKHHGAIVQTERMKEIAQERQELWLRAYGSVISCEWMFPKVIEMAEADFDLYQDCEAILEVSDWIVRYLTHGDSRSIGVAACNCMYRHPEGYPTQDYLTEVSPKVHNVVQEKLKGYFKNIGEQAGILDGDIAGLLGLSKDTAVGISIIDAHASVIASGAQEPGDMVMIVGTSAVELLLASPQENIGIGGIHISAQDANIPGLYTFGGGQNCVGDCFDWFIKNCVPEAYQNEAKNNGITIHELLGEKAAGLPRAGSGLLILDWWNGLRTPVFDFNLSGVIVGLRLDTRPEELYLALIEATAMNIRRTVSLFREAGHRVQRIFASGGIPRKNPLLMQVYADVLGCDIWVSESNQPGALGSAVLGAAAAFKTAPDEFSTVMNRMIKQPRIKYSPDKYNMGKYDVLYQKYRALSEMILKESDLFKSLGDMKHTEHENAIGEHT